MSAFQRFEDIEAWQKAQELTKAIYALSNDGQFARDFGPPRSRNEALASLMRRFRICEERGSGIDKVVSQTELFQLPAPLFERPVGFTRTVLFAHKRLAAMDKAERVRACYLHACLRYVTRQPMTNASLRQRLGIDARNIASASRILGEAVEAGLVVIADPEAGTRNRSYLPFWAGPRTEKGEVV